jgi:hypothetical protein
MPSAFAVPKRNVNFPDHVQGKTLMCLAECINNKRKVFSARAAAYQRRLLSLNSVADCQ